MSVCCVSARSHRCWWWTVWRLGPGCHKVAPPPWSKCSKRAPRWSTATGREGSKVNVRCNSVIVRAMQWNRAWETTRDREEDTTREAWREKYWDKESHLWPVLGKHSYELVGVGLATLVQQAGTQMLGPGHHLQRSNSLDWVEQTTTN